MSIALRASFFCLATACVAADQKIKNVVVVMMENRAYDHIFGWSTDLNANGLTGAECNYLDLQQRTDEICVTDDAININLCDPSHIVDATTYKLFGTYNDTGSATVTMEGFVAYEAAKENAAANNYCGVMSGFKPTDLPVINEIASEFAIFDRFFASVPGPTWPNRLMALTATSKGSDGDIWYQNVPGQFYPQKTFYEQLDESGLNWKNYYNDTPWELMIDYVARRPDNLHPMESFFKDCAEGTLPSFSWVNPRAGINITTGIGSNDFHPTHDAYAAEEFYKDIYEAVRSSLQWNDTLLIITFDEHGGFYDHVVTPSEGVPSPESEFEDYTTDTAYFNLQRLGVRIPTLAISPWIPKGTVISEAPSAQKPFTTSEYDLTSIMATVRKLFPSMTQDALTSRDAWSSTFEHVFSTLTEPRGDCPLHLIEANVPTPATDTDELRAIGGRIHAPLIDIQEDIARVHAHLAGVRMPHFVNQVVHAEWLANQYKQHVSLAKVYDAHIKGESLSFEVQMLLKNNPAGSGEAENQWDINGIPHGGNPLYEGTTAQYHTVSTRNLKSVTSESETPYCLDGGDGSVGSVLSVSPCLPSPDPYFNREPSQHFYYTPAGQLQFYDNSNPKSDWLCVTNHNPDGQADKIYLYLAACDIENTLQSWAYNGYAPGNGGDGLLAYGVHFVGVMEVSQDSESSDNSPKDVLSSTEIYVVGAAGGVLLLIVIAAVYFFWFKAGRGKDPITFVYRNNQENPITAGRTSSVNNQQGSVGSRVQSTAELSRSVSKSTTRSSAAYDQA